MRGNRGAGAPFSACGGIPSLRFGLVSLDEAEHFLHNRSAGVAMLGIIPDSAFGFAGIPIEWLQIYRGAHRDREPDAVSGTRRAAATFSGASRRCRREHRGCSERPAKAGTVPAGPVSFIPPARGLL